MPPTLIRLVSHCFSININLIIMQKLYIFNDTAVPILEKDAYVVSMDYSPLLAGFSIVLKDGRAAFLTSSNLKFDPNVRNLMNYA